MTCAKPISSSTVSPFIRRAVRKAAIWALVAPPDMMASIAAAASIRVRLPRSTSVRTVSVMIGLVMSVLPLGAAPGRARLPRPGCESYAEVRLLDVRAGEQVGAGALYGDAA